MTGWSAETTCMLASPGTWESARRFRLIPSTFVRMRTVRSMLRPTTRSAVLSSDSRLRPLPTERTVSGRVRDSTGHGCSWQGNQHPGRDRRHNQLRRLFRGCGPCGSRSLRRGHKHRKRRKFRGILHEPEFERYRRLWRREEIWRPRQHNRHQRRRRTVHRRRWQRFRPSTRATTRHVV